MNRRKKKPKQVDYFDLIKSKWAEIEWKLLHTRVKSVWSGLPKLHRRSLSILVPIVLILIFMPTPKSEDSEMAPNPNKRVAIKINPIGLSEQTPTQSSTSADPTSNNAPEQSTTTSNSQLSWKDYVVKAGDTLAKIFRSNGLSMADLNDLIRVEGTGKPLSHIQKGQMIRYKLDSKGQLDMLQLEKSSGSVIFFRLSSGGFAKK